MNDEVRVLSVVGVLTNPLNIVFPSFFFLFPQMKKKQKIKTIKTYPPTWPEARPGLLSGLRSPKASICLLVRHCEVQPVPPKRESNLSAIIDDLSVVVVPTNPYTPVCDHPSRGEFSPLLAFQHSDTNNIFFCPWLVSPPIHLNFAFLQNI